LLRQESLHHENRVFWIQPCFRLLERRRYLLPRNRHGPDGLYRALEDAEAADLLVKASGVGVFDEFLEKAILEIKRPGSLAVYWDVDAPATLDRLDQDPADEFHELIPRYDMIFTYGGGDPVVQAYTRLGARRCVPIYNAVDPATHYPVPPDPRFTADLGFLGNRLPDREARVEEFFLGPAARLTERRFVLGGNGWQDKPLPPNLHYAGHVYTADHNAFNCSSLAVLNISRASMARYGFSPATRVFEAAGAAACIVTDAWDGIGHFLEPGVEILVAEDGEQVVSLLEATGPKLARQIGWKAQSRVLAQHTYAHRARQVSELLGEIPDTRRNRRITRQPAEATL
jgi:spore maturation protein CgeB